MPSGQQQRQDRGEPCPERVADKRYLTIPEHPPASRAQSAKRAYRLALDQEKRLRPSLEFYLMEAHIRRIKQLETRIYVFSVMITNKSDSVNSLRELNLFIEHGRKPGLLSNVSIPHDPELAQYLPKGSGDPLFIPCQIAAHAVLGGLAIFRVPDDLIEQSRIESYLLKLIDSYGQETELEAILLSEVRDGPTDENRSADK